MDEIPSAAGQWIAIIGLAITCVLALLGTALSAGRSAQKLKDVALDVSDIKKWTAEKGDTITRTETRVESIEKSVSQLQRSVGGRGAVG